MGDPLEQSRRDVDRKLNRRTGERVVGVRVQVWAGAIPHDDPDDSDIARVSHDGLDLYVRHYAGDLIRDGWAELCMDATGAKALGVELIRMADAMMEYRND